MFQVKICGLTSPADALAAVEAGADAIGLNFYPPSPRFIRRETAREIVAAVGTQVCKVGLFVNASAAEILAARDELGLDLVQLHGDERPDLLRALAPRPVMKAFRIGPDGLAPLRRWFDEGMRGGLLPRMVLLDAYSAGRYGGTGLTTDWPTAAAYAATPGLPSCVLAGGLTPENVAAAIAAVRPAAVDVAGGVESGPGMKDAAKMQAFVLAAKKALEQARP
ncbi:MAG: phosphoribosylanthranilate isomerase [Planctomycetia bacterium]|nr:phosphoribosylanthranilate isomerase [Planctomycetia bacterium]